MTHWLHVLIGSQQMDRRAGWNIWTPICCRAESISRTCKPSSRSRTEGRSLDHQRLTVAEQYRFLRTNGMPCKSQLVPACYSVRFAAGRTCPRFGGKTGNAWLPGSSIAEFYLKPLGVAQGSALLLGRAEACCDLLICTLKQRLDV